MKSKQIKAIRHAWSPRHLTYLAMMTALTCVGRLVFALPVLTNIQPMSILLLMIVAVSGLVNGLIVANLSVLLTNLLLGMGPWTWQQMLTYSFLLCLFAGVHTVVKRHTSYHSFFMALMALLFGILYGFMISIITVSFYQIHAFWPYYLAGLPFDALHAFGNVIFYFILKKPLIPLLRRWALDKDR